MKGDAFSADRTSSEGRIEERRGGGRKVFFTPMKNELGPRDKVFTAVTLSIVATGVERIRCV